MCVYFLASFVCVWLFTCRHASPSSTQSPNQASPRPLRHASRWQPNESRGDTRRAFTTVHAATRRLTSGGLVKYSLLATATCWHLALLLCYVRAILEDICTVKKVVVGFFIFNNQNNCNLWMLLKRRNTLQSCTFSCRNCIAASCWPGVCLFFLKEAFLRRILPGDPGTDVEHFQWRWAALVNMPVCISSAAAFLTPWPLLCPTLGPSANSPGWAGSKHIIVIYYNCYFTFLVKIPKFPKIENLLYLGKMCVE